MIASVIDRGCCIFSTAHGTFLEVTIEKLFMLKDKDPKRAEPRKGSEDKSVAHDMDKNREAKYPRPSQEDRQYDNQPEFNEHQANRKDEDQV